MRLLPKDETFWNFFHEETASLTRASDSLRQAASGGNGQLAGAAIRIKALERKSAQTLRELQARLQKTFVTPIDPEDVSLLAEHLDHLIDEMEAIAYRLCAYELQPLPGLIVELCRRVFTTAEWIEKAFGLLSLNELTDEPCEKILEIEEETDQLVREGVTALFTQEKDMVKLLKQKEIYDLFERTSDSFQDLASALRNVSLKNA